MAVAKQAEAELGKSERSLARSKAMYKDRERRLEATLDELERLQNTLTASSNDLAAFRAANDHFRWAFVLPEETAFLPGDLSRRNIHISSEVVSKAFMCPPSNELCTEVMLLSDVSVAGSA